MATRFALIAVLTVPLGLDLYMPVPEDDPITAEKIARGRALFNDLVSRATADEPRN